MSKNLLTIFDITANRITQVKDGAVNGIEDLYASKSGTQAVLDSQADQEDTYTKEQIDANCYDISETYSETEINVLSNSISSNAYFILNNTATIASNLVNVSSNTFLIGNLTITSNTSLNNISSNTHLLNSVDSTVPSNFNSMSSSSNLINTNVNNSSLNTSLIK